MRKLPSRERLWDLLDYQPLTGDLTWKPRPSASHFRMAGTPAINYVNSQGYKVGRLDDAGVKAHRVIWKMMTGDDPQIIDHINGDRADNRWGNLRSVGRFENARNLGLSKNNTSGHNGVYWFPRYQKWMASIRINGKRKNLGYFATKEEAIAARALADAANGYTFRGATA